MRDHVYWFGTRGLIYTSPWVITESTERETAVLLLSASGRPFELRYGGQIVRHTAVAIAPLTRRGLRAVDVGLVSVNVQPDHPAYRAFCGIARPGVMPLDREDFADFAADLVRAYEGRLSHRVSERLFDGLVEAAAARVRSRRDVGSDALYAFLREHADGTLAEMARALDVSYTAASHLFTREMGLPFRTYRHWIKCMRAEERFVSKHKLTEIALDAGFADSAHLSRSWQRRFGFSPSHLRDPRRVRIVA